MSIRIDLHGYAIRSDGDHGFAVGKPYTVKKTQQEILQKARYYPNLSTALRGLVSTLAHVTQPDITSIAQYVERIEALWDELHHTVTRDPSQQIANKLVTKRRAPAIRLMATVQTTGTST